MPSANFTVTSVSPANLTSLIEPLPGIPADILRLDRLHPLLSGNKAFKLEGHLAAFAASGRQRLLSFGGPWSNHLHALSAAAHLLNIPLTLVVRGYAHLPLTATLSDCVQLGAELIFVDKQTYRRRDDPVWQAQLAAEHNALVVPEGGGGEPGLMGCQRLAQACAGYDQVWLACGTGTTALGLAQGLAEMLAQKPEQGISQLVGVNAVADQGALAERWQTEMPAAVRWRLLDDAHGGGFGKLSDAHKALIARFDAAGLALDPVYTVKLLAAFLKMYPDGDTGGQRILLIHSGGLQGRRGFGL